MAIKRVSKKNLPFGADFPTGWWRRGLAVVGSCDFLFKMEVETVEKSVGARSVSFRFRRNLLFVATLLTLVLVFLGAVPYHEKLAESPMRFAIFWIGIFVLVAAILALALYDLVRVRRDHKRRVRELERELAAAAAEARSFMRLMEQAKRDPKEDSLDDGRD